MTQNAKIVACYIDGKQLGACRVCKAEKVIDWLADGTARGRVAEVRAWMAFVARHEGCMADGRINAEDEAWLRRALDDKEQRT